MRSNHGNKLDLPSLRKVSFSTGSFRDIQLVQFESMNWRFDKSSILDLPKLETISLKGDNALSGPYSFFSNPNNSITNTLIMRSKRL